MSVEIEEASQEDVSEALSDEKELSEEARYEIELTQFKLYLERRLCICGQKKYKRELFCYGCLLIVPWAKRYWGDLDKIYALFQRASKWIEGANLIYVPPPREKKIRIRKHNKFRCPVCGFARTRQIRDGLRVYHKCRGVWQRMECIGKAGESYTVSWKDK